MKITDISRLIAKVLSTNSESLTATEIAKQADIPFKNCHNHLARLCENNIIEKLDDKTYVLTDFGVLEIRKKNVSDLIVKPVIAKEKIIVDAKKKEDLKITVRSLQNKENANGLTEVQNDS